MRTAFKMGIMPDVFRRMRLADFMECLTAHNEVEIYNDIRFYQKIAYCRTTTGKINPNGILGYDPFKEIGRYSKKVKPEQLRKVDWDKPGTGTSALDMVLKKSGLVRKNG